MIPDAALRRTTPIDPPEPTPDGLESPRSRTAVVADRLLTVALLGAIVTSAFKRGFAARLVETGLSKAQATSIVAKAGASAAAGNAQSGADATLTQAVQTSFVHAIHVGLFIAIGFLILASIVSLLFVRTHVGNHDAEEAAAYGH